MTSPDRDPFDELRRLPDAEPDREVMRATVAASREAFVRRTSARPQPGPKGWRTRLGAAFARPSVWLVPAGAGALSLAAVIVVLPDVLMQPGIVESATQRQAAPAEAAMEREAPAVTQMRPVPAAPQPETSSLADAVLTYYAEDGIRLGYRLEGGRYTLLLMTRGGGLLMDERAIGADSIEIVDALRVAPPDAPEIIAIRTRTGPSAATWNAYVVRGATITRDGELSALIADVPDAKEAKARLRGLTMR